MLHSLVQIQLQDIFLGHIGFQFIKVTLQFFDRAPQFTQKPSRHRQYCAANYVYEGLIIRHFVLPMLVFVRLMQPVALEVQQALALA